MAPPLLRTLGNQILRADTLAPVRLWGPHLYHFARNGSSPNATAASIEQTALELVFKAQPLDVAADWGSRQVT